MMRENILVETLKNIHADTHSKPHKVQCRQVDNISIRYSRPPTAAAAAAASNGVLRVHCSMPPQAFYSSYHVWYAYVRLINSSWSQPAMIPAITGFSWLRSKSWNTWQMSFRLFSPTSSGKDSILIWRSWLFELLDNLLLITASRAVGLLSLTTVKYCCTIK